MEYNTPHSFDKMIVNGRFVTVVQDGTVSITSPTKLDLRFNRMISPSSIDCSQPVAFNITTHDQLHFKGDIILSAVNIITSKYHVLENISIHVLQFEQTEGSEIKWSNC